VSGGAVTDEDHRHIATIVRMLDGVPLALELAAAWSGTLSFEEIAGEVQRGLDLLATRAIDRPDRHQSMRAVFVQTIMRLSADELSAFRGLCVFRGGFEREAAEKVAGANLPLLSALSDKSLVWRGEDGRFRVHELLRQYASEILLTPGEEAEQLGARHSDYYLGYLGSMWSDVIRGSQAQAAEAVKREKENVLAALRYATENKRFKGIGQVLHAFSLVEQFSGRYGEGVEVINGALDALQAEEPTQDVLRAIAQSAVDVAWLCLRVGLIDQSRQRIRQAEDAYAALSVPPLPGASTDPTLVSGVIALIQGDFVQAEKLGRHSAELAKRDNQNDNYPYSLYVLAGSALGRGDYEQARAYGLEAYEASRRENPWFTAYCLIELGTACAALGERDAAQRYFQESFDIRKTFSDPEGMALALNRLGELELDGKNYREAERLYAQSLRYYRETDDIGGRAASRRGLAEAYCGLGKHEASAGMLREALQDALRIGFVKQVLTIILCSGELLARAGKPEPAGRLLRWVIGQPAADKETIDRAHSLIGPDARPGEGLSLQEAADFADRELAAVVDHARPAMADAEALPEPLTERELEVLYYLADGMTNQQIAEKLIVSLGTIKAHTHAIFGKLGAENRVQAVSRAREAGLLS
jgi:ATP/maltotriose-dependent transcriptional regulator MalT